MLYVSPSIKIPMRELSFTFARSSGPGGQNVNKTSSKVQMKWHVASSVLKQDIKQRFIEKYASKIDTEGFINIMSQQSRDRDFNKQDCCDKLVTMLQSVLTPPKPRKETKPTYGSVQKRLSGKRIRSEIKKQRKADFD
jgi:ribosome-associated protein